MYCLIKHIMLFFTFSGPLGSGVLGLKGSTILFETRVAINPVLGDVRDVASGIISHEQTQSNRVCLFQTLDGVFPKDLFTDYLSIPYPLLSPRS